MLAICVPDAEVGSVLAELSQNGVSAFKVTERGFDGTQLVTIIIELTPGVLGFIAGYLGKRRTLGQETRILSGGAEIDDVSEETLRMLGEGSGTGA
jgi:hypothetical protein